MNSNTKTVALAMVGVVLVVVLGFLGRDFFLSRSGQIDCGDGARRTIDVRDFTTQYWAYYGEFEASIADKGKLSGKLDPKQLQAMSDSSQQMNEFRKYVVVGFNSCAITKQQYGELGSCFQQLDGLSRRIDGLAALPNPTDSDKAQLAKLVDEYVALTQQLGRNSDQ